MCEQFGGKPNGAAPFAVARQLHDLVTYGPWDLDVAAAMSTHGYDEVKWAEGQSMVAELISLDEPTGSTIRAAEIWYQEAACAARRALAAQPYLLGKLGLA